MTRMPPIIKNMGAMVVMVLRIMPKAVDDMVFFSNDLCMVFPKLAMKSLLSILLYGSAAEKRHCRLEDMSVLLRNL